MRGTDHTVAAGARWRAVVLDHHGTGSDPFKRQLRLCREPRTSDGRFEGAVNPNCGEWMIPALRLQAAPKVRNRQSVETLALWAGHPQSHNREELPGKGRRSIGGLSFVGIPYRV